MRTVTNAQTHTETGFTVSQQVSLRQALRACYPMAWILAGVGGAVRLSYIILRIRIPIRVLPPFSSH